VTSLASSSSCAVGTGVNASIACSISRDGVGDGVTTELVGGDVQSSVKRDLVGGVVTVTTVAVDEERTALDARIAALEAMVHELRAQLKCSEARAAQLASALEAVKIGQMAMKAPRGSIPDEPLNAHESSKNTSTTAGIDVEKSHSEEVSTLFVPRSEVAPETTRSRRSKKKLTSSPSSAEAEADVSAAAMAPREAILASQARLPHMPTEAAQSLEAPETHADVQMRNNEACLHSATVNCFFKC